MSKSLYAQYNQILDHSFELFSAKTQDYGITWLLYRPQSLNDELWRKGKRIRTLEEKNDVCEIAEGRADEYIALINYSIMFLIRLEDYEGIPSGESLMENLSLLDGVSTDSIFSAYKDVRNKAWSLMFRKNTDYGDAWRSMSMESMTDQVIVRVYRIRRILQNGGQCKVSEGISSQLYDILNYCVFALIKMGWCS